MDQIKLSIILPSLKPKQLEECLYSILEYTFLPFELVFVIDDIENFQFLKKLTPEYFLKKVTILFDTKKIGTVYPINLGLEKCVGEYIVTLSDDARVTPCWADEMYDFLQKQDQSKPLLGNFRVYDKNGEYGPIGYLGNMFSMFPFIKRSDIDKVGGYYLSEYNAHYGDPDLGMRVWKANGQVITCPYAWIYHVSNWDMVHKSNYDRYFAKDEVIFAKKWANSQTPKCQQFNRKYTDQPPLLWLSYNK